MSVMYLVLPLSLLLVAVAVGVFAWAVRSGQLDDLVTPALRVLADDEHASGDDEREADDHAAEGAPPDGTPDA